MKKIHSYLKQIFCNNSDEDLSLIIETDTNELVPEEERTSPLTIEIQDVQF